MDIIIDNFGYGIHAWGGGGGVSNFTIRKWRKRMSVADNRNTPHRRRTTLNADQEEIAVYLHKHLRLPLDDLLAVARESSNRR